jgi:hypothetical protein
LEKLLDLEHWLYAGMATRLGDAAGGDVMGRHGVGRVLEIGGSVMVLVFGLWMVLRSVST